MTQETDRELLDLAAKAAQLLLQHQPHIKERRGFQRFSGQLQHQPSMPTPAHGKAME